MNTIETARLLIRPMEEQDFELYFGLRTEYMLESIISKVGKDTFLETVRKNLADSGDVIYLIFLKETMEYCGNKETMEYCGNLELQGISGIGIELLETYQNRGIGTEAMIAFGNFLYHEQNIRQLDVKIFPDNTRCIHVFEKLGAELVSEKSLFEDLFASTGIDLKDMESSKLLCYKLPLPIKEI